MVTYAVKSPFTPVCHVAAADPHRALCARVIRLLREERERQGVSKYAIEQRTGVSQQMVGYVERGLRNPSLEVALRIAAALGVNLADVIRAAQESVKTPSAKPKK